MVRKEIIIAALFIVLGLTKLLGQSENNFHYFVNDEKQNLTINPLFYVIDLDNTSNKKKSGSPTFVRL